MSKIATILFLLGVSLQVARGQLSIATIFPVGSEGDELEGFVEGTGGTATTYILSGTFGTFGIPYTMTLVEDASSVLLEVADVPTGTDTLHILQDCSISGSLAGCTEIIALEGIATTFALTGGPALVPIHASTKGDGSSTANTTSVPPRTTASVSTPGSTGSMLPPQLPTSGTPSTGAQPSQNSPAAPSQAPASSDALRSQYVNLVSTVALLVLFLVGRCSELL